MAVGGSTAYAGFGAVPPRVRAALDVADAQDFDHSCAPEQGRLLAALAGGRSGGRIGETGTGCGVGLAWMTSTTTPDTTFVSVELDARRAAAAADVFSDLPAVTVYQGDWSTLVEHGPFDLLVLDGGGKGKPPDTQPPLDPTAGWLNVGGMIVLDDFLPLGAPGAEEHDANRWHWLRHPALVATEIRLTPTLATIVGVRVR